MGKQIRLHQVVTVTGEVGHAVVKAIIPRPDGPPTIVVRHDADGSDQIVHVDLLTPVLIGKTSVVGSNQVFETRRLSLMSASSARSCFAH